MAERDAKERLAHTIAALERGELSQNKDDALEKESVGAGRASRSLGRPKQGQHPGPGGMLKRRAGPHATGEVGPPTFDPFGRTATLLTNPVEVAWRSTVATTIADPLPLAAAGVSPGTGGVGGGAGGTRSLAPLPPKSAAAAAATKPSGGPAPPRSVPSFPEGAPAGGGPDSPSRGAKTGELGGTTSSMGWGSSPLRLAEVPEAFWKTVSPAVHSQIAEFIFDQDYDPAKYIASQLDDLHARRGAALSKQAASVAAATLAAADPPPPEGRPQGGAGLPELRPAGGAAATPSGASAAPLPPGRSPSPSTPPPAPEPPPPPGVIIAWPSPPPTGRRAASPLRAAAASPVNSMGGAATEPGRASPQQQQQQQRVGSPESAGRAAVAAAAAAAAPSMMTKYEEMRLLRTTAALSAVLTADHTGVLGSGSVIHRGPGAVARSRWFRGDGTFEWLSVAVTAASEDGTTFAITWLHDRKGKTVSRFNILFDGESEEGLDELRRAALEHQRRLQQQLQYNAARDSVPLSAAPALHEAMLEGIVNRLGLQNWELPPPPPPPAAAVSSSDGATAAAGVGRSAAGALGPGVGAGASRVKSVATATSAGSMWHDEYGGGMSEYGGGGYGSGGEYDEYGGGEPSCAEMEEMSFGDIARWEVPFPARANRAHKAVASARARASTRPGRAVAAAAAGPPSGGADGEDAAAAGAPAGSTGAWASKPPVPVRANAGKRPAGGGPEDSRWAKP
ncbi:hypothetical protein TSOC_001046 [Tetrabaena socialis]|uniref:Uncharacterized protein n=1 Tax=Tetrabaena socialis TaxID=47790 RepID=A0A2J8AHS1_9CHLO|nr:hypothetical protein TSOC_001046 [Tetrabaena socialis]|eukprot:PNH12051.1 hypothetical protein TSOC_001046 [Tetrabaena socialis]